MQHTAHYALPDPDRRPEFYRGVAMKRGFAWAIDLAIAAMIAAMIVPFTFFIAIFFFPFLTLTVSFVYRWVTLANFGATFGMRLMALELLNDDGSRPNAQTTLFHAFGTTMILTVFPLHIVSTGMVMAMDRGQSLADYLVGTVMLNRAYTPV